MNFREPFSRCHVSFTPESLVEAINKVLNDSPPINIPKLIKLDKAALACFIKGDNTSPEAKIIQSAMAERLGHVEVPKINNKVPNPYAPTYFFERNVRISAEIQGAIDRLARLAFLLNAKEVSTVLGCVLFELKDTLSRLRQDITSGRV